MIVTIPNGKLRYCDNCHREMRRWEVITLMKSQRHPGDNFENCSSDIRSTSSKIADLCPECMEEVEELYLDFRKEKCV